MNAEITVVIPTYNKADYISQTIESVLRQTYQNFEIVIIDDCSGDNTEDVVQKYQSDKVRYFKHEKNWGPGATFNDGIQISRTEYVTLIASDDILLPNHLESVMYEFKNNASLEVIFARSEVIDENGDKQNKSGNFFCIEKFKLLNLLFYEGNLISSPGISLKKSMFNTIKPFNPSLIYTHDYDLNIRCLLYANVFFMNVPTILYRKFNNGVPQLSGNSEWVSHCYMNELNFIFANYLNLPYEIAVKIFPDFSIYSEKEFQFYFMIDCCKNSRKDISSWAFMSLVKYFNNNPDFFKENIYGFEYKDYINLYKLHAWKLRDRHKHKRKLFLFFKTIVKKILFLR
ncbi:MULTISPECIES: glycosyltransferase [unclassified Treponema]|uniref:glycosyltransferase n=1 Tax=unclassified Treponema TaxID=2638727 RepID=UPI0020A48BA9|nr:MULTISPECIES: glycosyltransferase [unclassified Treponema]UTC68203.1 glycosyltransferase [Treponema sp. OMZ 789]UTC70923.1 glycosyltransferase [Treponema sp. OMZ 790]UTC73663.1 glycosyltransferase [Treponema sp. OMZ 791]